MYEEKNDVYYSQIREDLINLISGKDNKILDIGCAGGEMGKVLKKMGKAKEVVGIEICKGIALKAQEQLDKVICGDVEKINLPFEEGYFDYIIMGDVIEHLIDPWSALRKISRFLSTRGYLIASIPNISYWRIIKDLVLFDKWEYQKAGILDKAHLRFFTKRSMVEMMKEAGFEVRSIRARRSLGTKAKLFDLVTLGIFRKFFESAYIIKCKKWELVNITS